MYMRQLSRLSVYLQVFYVVASDPEDDSGLLSTRSWYLAPVFGARFARGVEKLGSFWETASRFFRVVIAWFDSGYVSCVRPGVFAQFFYVPLASCSHFSGCLEEYRKNGSRWR